MLSSRYSIGSRPSGLFLNDRAGSVVLLTDTMNMPGLPGFEHLPCGAMTPDPTVAEFGLAAPDLARRSPMRNIIEDTITQAVVASMREAEDARLRTVMTCLVQHLHSFAREVKLTEDEWFQAI